MYKNPHGYNWIHTQSTSRSLQTQLIRNLKVDDHIQTTSRIGWGWGRAGVFHQVRSLHFSSRFVVFLVTSREAGESFFQDLGLIQVGWESIDYPTCLLGNPSEMECAHQKRLWFIIEVSKNGWSKLYTHGYTCTCIHLWLAFFCWLRQKTKNCSDLMVSIRMSTITWSSTGCPFFRYFKALAPSLAFGVGYWRRNTRILTKWI